MPIEAVNPATGELIAGYPGASDSEVRAAIARADDAFRAWRRTSFDERSAVLRGAAALLREQADDLARLMAWEMGKVIGEGRAEATKCALVCDYYAQMAERFLAEEPVELDSGTGLVTFAPLGVVLAVMPWNFPLWQVFRFAAPALMAGNACLLKHASNVPGCALAIERILREAGLPDRLFTTLLIGSSKVPLVVGDPCVRAVTLTGSGPAGRSVAAEAGRDLKKIVLELGGSDPYVILEDAHIPTAAATCVTSRLTNCGQSCIAAKRFVVVEDVLDEFTECFLEGMSAARMGDPLDETTTIGPLARLDLRQELHQQVTRSIEVGAECLFGGEISGGPGAFYPPTVLAGVRPGMSAHDEELFGPVAAIIGVKDEAEAIAVANDSAFGLGAAVFTRDLARGRRIATEELEAGCCFVNAFVRSDPRLPFGGIKDSGHGRELSHYGIREFVNIKTVFIA